MMNVKELTDRQIMEEIRRIFLRRKRVDGLSQETLAAEIGIGRPTLWYAINKKVASRTVMAKLTEFLENQGGLIGG